MSESTEPLISFLRACQTSGNEPTLRLDQVTTLLDLLDSHDALIPHPVGFEAIIAPLPPITDPAYLTVYRPDLNRPFLRVGAGFNPATQGFAFQPLPS